MLLAEQGGQRLASVGTMPSTAPYTLVSATDAQELNDSLATNAFRSIVNNLGARS